MMPAASQQEQPKHATPRTQLTTKRLVSLDAFRGLTIASMILVNNPGPGAPTYRQLEHADWNGWTFTDTVFPFFLWIVGVAITLSTAKRLEAGADRRIMMVHIIRRAALLYALGFFLAGFPYFHLAHIRFLGVLPRIAICYFVAATLFLFTRWRLQVAAIVLLSAVYWILMVFYPVPGLGAGHLEEGHNFASYVDGLVLTAHMWSVTKTWDPEGLISTLPAIVTTLFGILAGHLLRSSFPIKGKLARLIAFGLGLVAAGQGSNIWLPINKNLWTVSFAFFMAGLATLEFSALFWVLDIVGYQRWAKPFVVYGMNAIAVFVLSGITGRLLALIHVADRTTGKPISLSLFIYQSVFAPLAAPINSSLLFALTYVVGLFLVAWFLYSRRWFLRV